MLVRFPGQFYDKVVPTVTRKTVTFCLLSEVITHSYYLVYDWRTKKPIIWRAVPQWLHHGSKFRQDILDEIDPLTFYPEWGHYTSLP